MSPAPAPVTPLVFHWFYAKAAGSESEQQQQQQGDDQEQGQERSGEASRPSEPPDWQPFSRGDSTLLEREYQAGESGAARPGGTGHGGARGSAARGPGEDGASEDESARGEEEDAARKDSRSGSVSLSSEEERERASLEEDAPQGEETKKCSCSSCSSEERREEEDELSEAESWHEDWTELDWLTDWFGNVKERPQQQTLKKQPDWVPFCKADSDAIEAAFLGGKYAGFDGVLMFVKWSGWLNVI